MANSQNTNGLAPPAYYSEVYCFVEKRKYILLIVVGSDSYFLLYVSKLLPVCINVWYN